MWIALVTALMAAPADPSNGPQATDASESAPADDARVYAITTVSTDDVLILQPDGSVLLERHLALVVPEPPPLEGEESAEESVDDEADESEEDPGMWVTVRLAHSAGEAQALTVTGDVTSRGIELREESVPVLDTQQALGEVDAVREQLRQDIEAAEDAAKRDEVTVRPDLDLLEALVAGSDDVTPLSAQDRSDESIAWLSAQLGRATTAATLILDGEPVVHDWADVHVDSLEPGEYAMVLSNVVPEARWVSGYVLDAPPEAGAVRSVWMAGLSVPAEVGFEDVVVHVDWGQGPVEAAQSPTTLIAGTELHTIVLAELPNTYRNIVGEDDVQRRVDVRNPFEHPLPAMRSTLGTTTFPTAALEAGESFRLGLGPAVGWRVKRKGNEYDIRTNLPNPTPVWIPIDPTGCRIAASGEVEGMEEIDGQKGVTARLSSRGIVSVMCD